MEGFLPPKPSGPEPDLGPRPQAPPHPAAPYAPQPSQADNGPAVTGFVLSIVAGGLLIISGGISSIVSVTCAIFGIVQSRRGKRRVQSGETTRNAGLAQAGFIIGIVALVLSVIATLVWVAIVVLLATDEEFRRDFEDEFEDEFDESTTVKTAVRVAVAAGRAFLA